jgi:hypothetical protein
MAKIYENRKMVLLTQHEKEKAIKNAIEKETGCELVVESGFDTDKFGTFSREIKRPKSQLDTARMKIKKAIKLFKADLAIASEGSFGSHPYAPIPWNVELVLLYDKKENFELFGVYEGPETNLRHLRTDSLDEALKFAQDIGFPQHFVIIRPDDEFSKKIIKDIKQIDQLKDAFYWCQKNSHSNQVFIETDMRAHANPTRMKNIEKATHDLLSKLMNLCPDCGAPGFIIKKVVTGLPCELCGTSSDMALKYIFSCHKCNYISEQLYPKGQFAPAQYCDYCNP